jgi:6-phosphogluconolactonase
LPANVPSWGVILRVLPDLDAAASEAADLVAAAARTAIARAGRFTLALSGGRTPRALHAHLLSRAMDWERTIVLFGDERCVPPAHPDSNYRMVRETLLDRLPRPPVEVLRMEGERSPQDAAARYAEAMCQVFPGTPVPRLDLVILGMGPDGHTASLFPGTAALEERERWVAANHVPQLRAWRLTLTLPVLQSAAEVLFLIAGEDKAPVFAEAFGGKPHPAPYPSELVRPREGVLLVLADRAAASGLPQPLP